MGVAFDMRRAMMGQNPLVEATATGNPVTFSTTVAKPLVHSVIAMEPVQAGSGDPAPDNVRPITGWTGCKVTRCGINIINMPTFAKIQTYPKTGSYRNVPIKVKPNTTYYLNTTYLNGYTSIGKGFYVLVATDVNNTGWKAIAHHTNGKSNGTLTADSSGYLYMNVLVQESQYNELLANSEISLTEGSTAPTTYSPYTGQTIPVTFPALGKNLFDNSKYSQAAQYTVVGNYSYTYTPIIYLSPNTQYTIAPTASGTLTGVTYYVIRVYSGDETGTEQGTLYRLVNNGSYGHSSTFTTGTTGAIRIGINHQNDMQDRLDTIYNAMSFQLEAGSTATAFEPYTNTVYGGTVDLATGTLTVDKAMYILPKVTNSTFNVATSDYIKTDACDGFIQLNSAMGAISPKSNIWNSGVTGCNYFRFQYKTGIWSAPGYPNCYVLNGMQFHMNIANDLLGITDYTQETTTTAKDKMITYLNDLYDNGERIQVWYEIDPITYHLTPQQITALIGDNVLWSDTNGNNTVTYLKKK